MATVVDGSLKAQGLVIIVENPDTLSSAAVSVKLKKDQKDGYRNRTVIQTTVIINGTNRINYFNKFPQTSH